MANPLPWSKQRIDLFYNADYDDFEPKAKYSLGGGDPEGKDKSVEVRRVVDIEWQVLYQTGNAYWIRLQFSNVCKSDMRGNKGDPSATMLHSCCCWLRRLCLI